MISSKKELRFYIMADRMMNRGYFRVPLKVRLANLLNSDDIMRFLSLMRNCSYYSKRGGVFSRFLYVWYRVRYIRLSGKLGYTMDYNCFGYGLVLHHYGTIVVGSGSRIGNYANILHNCTISRGGSSIGDYFFMGAGSIITRPVVISDNVKVAANSVVNRAFEADVVVAGTPAQIRKRNETIWTEMYSGKEGMWEKRRRMCEELKSSMGL